MPGALLAAGPRYAERGSDAYLRSRGREFLTSFYGALRAVKLYPPENAVVQRALEELATISAELVRREHELEVRVSGKFIFLNGTRLRLDLDNFASFSRTLAVFREAEIGLCRFADAPTPREWAMFLSLLQSDSRSAEPWVDVGARLRGAGVQVFELGPLSELDESDYRAQAKEAAKRVYAHSVMATREVMESLRMGRGPNLKKIKRVVQGIVDQILNEETSLIGLTTLRDHDEYTFTHSVNVCIFSVALGRKLGFNKRQLYDLGVAALMHDVGKARVPQAIITKPGGLGEEEWRAIRAHPWYGVLTLFAMRGQGEPPFRAMVVAHEHHMKTDLSGYPGHVRPRSLSIFSRIVAVADGFDAATTQRAYQADPFSPVDALNEMRVNPKRGMDPVIVKAFISMVGHYPVGTLLLLDTYELALVHAASADPEAISRPIVRIISDTAGNVTYPGQLVDLTTQVPATGEYARNIIKIEEPDRYGIRVSDYYL